MLQNRPSRSAAAKNPRFSAKSVRASSTARSSGLTDSPAPADKNVRQAFMTRTKRDISSGVGVDPATAIFREVTGLYSCPSHLTSLELARQAGLRGYRPSQARALLLAVGFKAVKGKQGRLVLTPPMAWGNS